jgi:putative ATP-binding cassette transporter
MNLLRYLYRQSNSLFLIAALCAAISGVCGAVLIAVISEGSKAGTTPATFALKFFSFCLALLLTKCISQIAMVHLTQNTVFEMRVNLSKKLLACRYKKLQMLGKSELMVILTKDIEGFVGALQISPRLVTEGIAVMACFGYLAWLSAAMFAILLLTLTVCVGLFIFAQRRPLKQFKEMRAKLDDLFANFRDLVEGSRELQLNKRRGQLFVDEVVAGDASAFRETSIRGLSSFTIIANTGDMLFYLVIGLLLFVVPIWLPQPAGVLSSVTLVLLYLVGPLSNLVNSRPSFAHAAIALGRIQQLDADLDEEASSVSGTDPFTSASKPLLELREVCHHYPGATDDRPFLLGPVNLTVNQGEILFIVGGNGSGKTTLAMLLLGLYSPESGSVRMNGVRVEQTNIEHYRQHFGAVFADFHLFEHLLGIAPADIEERATHYIHKLGLEHKVRIDNRKFSTINLSTGQRKRLALITSYLEDKPIYLFDEWAADQDPAFKRVFYTVLLPELKAKGKTVIVISHDDGYFGSADRVVKLEDGRLEEGRLGEDRQAHDEREPSAA